jgi:hypothetical protein
MCQYIAVFVRHGGLVPDRRSSARHRNSSRWRWRTNGWSFGRSVRPKNVDRRRHGDLVEGPADVDWWFGPSCSRWAMESIILLASRDRVHKFSWTTIPIPNRSIEGTGERRSPITQTARRRRRKKHASFRIITAGPAGLERRGCDLFASKFGAHGVTGSPRRQDRPSQSAFSHNSGTTTTDRPDKEATAFR